MPAARRSKSDPMTTTLASFATRASASLDGPGIGSASSKFAWSSVWQKYRERKSSGRQITCAPAFAASRTRATARSRFSRGSLEQRIWMRPKVTLSGVAIRPTILAAPAKASDDCVPGTRARRGGLRPRLVDHLVEDVAQQAIPRGARVGEVTLRVREDARAAAVAVGLADVRRVLPHPDGDVVGRELAVKLQREVL